MSAEVLMATTSTINFYLMIYFGGQDVLIRSLFPAVSRNIMNVDIMRTDGQNGSALSH